MKVLLMVEREGRVVCASRSVGHDPAEILWGQKWLEDSGFYVWEPAYHAARSADRWWLVEAESAEAARRTITCAEVGCIDRVCGAADAPSCLAGRILASGGRS